MPLSPACMSATFSGSAYISFITDCLHSSLIITMLSTLTWLELFDNILVIPQQELNKRYYSGRSLIWTPSSKHPTRIVHTVYVQTFTAHNFHGFRGFLKSVKIKLVKFWNTIYSKLLLRKNCFHKMFENSNPQNLRASKIWTYTVYSLDKQFSSNKQCTEHTCM